MRPFVRDWLKFNLKTLFLAVLVAAVAAMVFERYWVTRPLVWQPFSAKVRDEALASGKIVPIKFRADWDVKSAMLDRAFVNSAELRSLIRRNRIVTIEMDFTYQTRAVIRDAERSYRQDMVPMVAIYKPDKPDVPYLADHVFEVEDLLAIVRRTLAAKSAPAANSFQAKTD